MMAQGTSTPDWYERRDELTQGQVFELRDGSRVMLDRRVPGDATAWFIADWCKFDWCEGWSYVDHRIELSDMAKIIHGAAF